MLTRMFGAGSFVAALALAVTSPVGAAHSATPVSRLTAVTPVSRLTAVPRRHSVTAFMRVSVGVIKPCEIATQAREADPRGKRSDDARLVACPAASFYRVVRPPGSAVIDVLF